MRNKLNQNLWDGDELNPEVKIKLIEIAQHFYEYLNIKTPILDIIFTGSLSNYNYHADSDIDLHIVIDFDEVGCTSSELTKELLKAKKDIYNLNRNITVKGFRVELYAQDVNEIHSSSGLFSILQNKWLKKPKINNKPIDNQKVLKLSNIYKELINDVSKLEDEDLKLVLANSIRKDIIKKRKDGLEQDGEYSTGNLLFKKLRKDEFYKLFDAISNITDRKLSLEQKRP